MIPHSYTNASDAPGQYAADQCNRQAVTVAFAYEHLTDEPLFTFDAEAEDYGLDPWRLFYELDRSTRSTELYYIRDREVSGEYEIYAQRKDLLRLGLAIPCPRGFAGHSR